MKLFGIWTMLATAVLLSGCSASEAVSSNIPNNAQKASEPAATAPAKPFKLSVDQKYPTVGLTEYTLITDDLERDRSNAEAVIQTKIELPHAMQTKQRSDFEAILSRNFVFRADDEFYDRDGYINNRVGDPAKVKQADYRNVVVQFIGDKALVTYANIVEDQPGGPGAWKADMSWADILVKEGDGWKYEVVHMINFVDLTTPRQE